jgi:parallel beta-helix repeat protein
MRTITLIRTLAVLGAVLAMSMSVISSASAHQRHATKHGRRHHHHRHHRRHSVRHGRRHHRHHHHAQAASAPAGASTPGQPTSFPAPQITGTTYYVSPTGSDANTGTSPAQAWRSVYEVNKMSTHLKPGDAVLFQGGASFGDTSLQPGWGNPLSGSSNAPIVFGSYGFGRAALPQGVWLHNSRFLMIDGLDVGPKAGISGDGNNITIEGSSIHDTMPGLVTSGQEEEAINAIGSQWTIRGNAINRTGDSGMLIRGDHFQITGNVITNTGLDPAITYGDHGIYLKATDSTVSGNTIANFHNDGISIRYRDSVVTGNTITGGQFGLAWFQYDSVSGTSHWTANTISHSSIAAIYVSPSDPTGGATRESFVISGNSIVKPSAGSGRWVALALEKTSGTYTVSNNHTS